MRHNDNVTTGGKALDRLNIRNAIDEAETRMETALRLGRLPSPNDVYLASGPVVGKAYVTALRAQRKPRPR